jgi:hypothetical protein
MSNFDAERFMSRAGKWVALSAVARDLREIKDNAGAFY